MWKKLTKFVIKKKNKDAIQIRIENLRQELIVHKREMEQLQQKHNGIMQRLNDLVRHKEGGIVELERLINGGNDKNTKQQK